MSANGAKNKAAAAARKRFIDDAAAGAGDPADHRNDYNARNDDGADVEDFVAPDHEVEYDDHESDIDALERKAERTRKRELAAAAAAAAEEEHDHGGADDGEEPVVKRSRAAVVLDDEEDEDEEADADYEVEEGADDDDEEDDEEEEEQEHEDEEEVDDDEAEQKQKKRLKKPVAAAPKKKVKPTPTEDGGAEAPAAKKERKPRPKPVLKDYSDPDSRQNVKDLTELLTRKNGKPVIMHAGYEWRINQIVKAAPFEPKDPRLWEPGVFHPNYFIHAATDVEDVDAKTGEKTKRVVSRAFIFSPKRGALPVYASTKLCEMAVKSMTHGKDDVKEKMKARTLETHNRIMKPGAGGKMVPTAQLPEQLYMTWLPKNSPLLKKKTLPTKRRTEAAEAKTAAAEAQPEKNESDDILAGIFDDEPAAPAAAAAAPKPADKEQPKQKQENGGKKPAHANTVVDKLRASLQKKGQTQEPVVRVEGAAAAAEREKLAEQRREKEKQAAEAKESLADARRKAPATKPIDTLTLETQPVPPSNVQDAKRAEAEEDHRQAQAAAAAAAKPAAAAASPAKPVAAAAAAAAQTMTLEERLKARLAAQRQQTAPAGSGETAASAPGKLLGSSGKRPSPEPDDKPAAAAAAAAVTKPTKPTSAAAAAASPAKPAAAATKPAAAAAAAEPADDKPAAAAAEADKKAKPSAPATPQKGSDAPAAAAVPQQLLLQPPALFKEELLRLVEVAMKHPPQLDSFDFTYVFDQLDATAREHMAMARRRSLLFTIFHNLHHGRTLEELAEMLSHARLPKSQ